MDKFAIFQRALLVAMVVCLLLALAKYGHNQVQDGIFWLLFAIFVGITMFAVAWAEKG